MNTTTNGNVVRKVDPRHLEAEKALVAYLSLGTVKDSVSDTLAELVCSWISTATHPHHPPPMAYGIACMAANEGMQNGSPTEEIFNEMRRRVRKYCHFA